MGGAACGPRCGECRRGIGVHEPRDPLCAWHEPPAHPDAEVIYASGWPRRYKGIDVHHETPDDGCYICQPDNPRADPEGCSDCDRKAHTPRPHTRTQTDHGPDFCAECSQVVSEYVTWPCTWMRSEGESLTND